MDVPASRRAFGRRLIGDRRAFLKTATAGSLFAAASPARLLAGPSRPPNIVLILCDDLGYGDIRCHGSSIATPNLDQMANEGARFSHFYAGGPTCSPSRASLMTGRYPVRTGIPRVLDPDEAVGLPKSETTIAQMLKPAGYNTMAIGKWHLGTPAEFLPTNRGFDEYYGVPNSIDMAPRPLMHNLDVIEQPANLASLTERYTQQAINFIDRAQSQPFFLFLAHSFPHIPYVASAPFAGGSGEGSYGDTIQEIDASVGRVIQALQRNGIDQNTLVMFTSDHGPWYQGSTGGLRGRKGEIWEGGMRVPFLARYPALIPPNQVVNGLASNLDVLPTVASLAGATLPVNPLDGYDITDMMTGAQKQIHREPFLFFNDICLQAARQGPWKLHVSRFNTLPFTPEPVGGRMNLPLPGPELYNVVTDADESHDRSGRNPAIVADLKASMARLIQTFPDVSLGDWNATLTKQVCSTAVGALPILAK